MLADPRRDAANAEALRRMTAAGADLVDVRPAHEALGLERGTFLHAGPPIEFARASGPLKGALIGAMLFEGLADTAEEAEAKLEQGDGITLEPCHHRDAVGPMAGVISPSMWVYELRDEVHDNTSWCSLNEGLGKVLRYGAYGPEVIDRLRWMNTVLGPILQQAVRARVEREGRIDVKAIIAQMLQMGDEGHNRNRAGSLMLLRELLPTMITADASSSDIAEAVRFSGANEHFFLNLGMPACKLSTLAAHGIPGSSVVTTMARNGTDFGIRVSGTGDAWFTGPANTPEGLFLGVLRPGRRQPRHRRLGDHRDGGHRRLRDGRGPGDREVRRWRRAVRAAGDADDVRDHGRGAHGLPGADPRVPRHADRHRRGGRRADRHPAADQHRHGRSRRGHRPGRRRASSRRPSSASRRPSPPSPRRWPKA